MEREERDERDEKERKEERGGTEKELAENGEQHDIPNKAAIITHLPVIFSPSAFEQCSQESRQYSATPLPCHVCVCVCVCVCV